MQLRDYQQEISKNASDKIKSLGVVYLNCEVRTGKTLIALNTANLFGADNVLFITKKKAISSIESDYANFEFNFNITVINKESLHKIDGKFDFVIVDEAHSYASFPKPSKQAKQIKLNYSHLPMVLMSGTMCPEGYAQIYHQFWLSSRTPFIQFKTFYKWANNFVEITQMNFGYGMIKSYSRANYEKIKPIIDNYIITLTQEEAGFTSKVVETIIHLPMSEMCKIALNKLKKDKMFYTKSGDVVIADSGAKMMSKTHQICSGTIITDEGSSLVFDTSKAIFIKDKFKENKIAIFYKFKAELEALKTVFKDNLTMDLNEFNRTPKNIAYQIVSGREGVNLSKADYIVYYNIDFSAVSYWQSRDRMTTKDRLKNEVFWIFTKGGIEDKVYKAVMSKKNFTLKTFENDRAGYSN